MTSTIFLEVDRQSAPHLQHGKVIRFYRWDLAADATGQWLHADATRHRFANLRCKPGGRGLLRLITEVLPYFSSLRGGEVELIV